MAHETTERFRALYLNAGLELLADETVAMGSVDSAPFLPRVIIARALELGATSLIVAHNHPSGSPTPSPEDVECTRHLAALCSSLGMTLLDHVVVAARGTQSLRQAGFLDK